MSLPFVLAYRYAYQIPQKEAKEKLEVLRRYLLPVEKPLTKEQIEEIFKSVFQIPEEKLSILKHEELLSLHFYLYNLLLFRARGEEISSDYDKELEFLRYYEDLYRRFPEVEIDEYPEEVVKAFARERRREIEETIVKEFGEEILKKFYEKCRGKVYLDRTKRYFAVSCYSYRDKLPKVAITTTTKEEKAKKLYALLKPLSLVKEC